MLTFQCASAMLQSVKSRSKINKTQNCFPEVYNQVELSEVWSRVMRFEQL